jgi:hypothetical protein
LEQARAQALVAAGGRVVAGQPGGHGQQLPEGDRAHPRVGVLGQVGGQQLSDGLVQALEVVVAEGDADQRGDDALVTEWSSWPSAGPKPCQ